MLSQDELNIMKQVKENGGTLADAMSMIKNKQPQQQGGGFNVMKGLQGVKNAYTGLAGRIGENVSQQFNAGQDIAARGQEKISQGKYIQGGVDVLTGGVKSLISPVIGTQSGIAQPAVEAVSQNLPKMIEAKLKEKYGQEQGKAVYNKLATKLKGDASKIKEAYDSSPDWVKTAVDAVVVGTDIATTIGTGLGAQKATTMAAGGIKKGVAVVEKGLESTGKQVKGAVEKAASMTASDIPAGVETASRFLAKRDTSSLATELLREPTKTLDPLAKTSLGKEVLDPYREAVVKELATNVPEINSARKFNGDLDYKKAYTILDDKIGKQGKEVETALALAKREGTSPIIQDGKRVMTPVNKKATYELGDVESLSTDFLDRAKLSKSAANPNDRFYNAIYNANGKLFPKVKEYLKYLDTNLQENLKNGKNGLDDYYRAIKESDLTLKNAGADLGDPTSAKLKDIVAREWSKTARDKLKGMVAETDLPIEYSSSMESLNKLMTARDYAELHANSPELSVFQKAEKLIMQNKPAAVTASVAGLAVGAGTLATMGIYGAGGYLGYQTMKVIKNGLRKANTVLLEMIDKAKLGKTSAAKLDKLMSMQSEVANSIANLERGATKEITGARVPVSPEAAVLNGDYMQSPDFKAYQAGQKMKQSVTAGTEQKLLPQGSAIQLEGTTRMTRELQPETGVKTQPAKPAPKAQPKKTTKAKPASKAKAVEKSATVKKGILKELRMSTDELDYIRERNPEFYEAAKKVYEQLKKLKGEK